MEVPVDKGIFHACAPVLPEERSSLESADEHREIIVGGTLAAMPGFAGLQCRDDIAGIFESACKK